MEVTTAGPVTSCDANSLRYLSIITIRTRYYYWPAYNGPVLFCSRRLSGSVTLHGGPAGGFTRAGQAMTSGRLQYNFTAADQCGYVPLGRRLVNSPPDILQWQTPVLGCTARQSSLFVCSGVSTGRSMRANATVCRRTRPPKSMIFKQKSAKLETTLAFRWTKLHSFRPAFSRGFVLNPTSGYWPRPPSLLSPFQYPGCATVNIL